MFELPEVVLHAFGDELCKEAGFSDLVAGAAPRLKNIGSVGGAGMLLGSLGGAAMGGVRHYQAARGEGAGVGEALTQGMGGAAHGALGGAAAGALAGGVAGGLAKGDLSGLAQRSGLVGAGARSGQRQVHALTGMLSPAELEGVRGGAWGARQSAGRALASGDANAARKATRGLQSSEEAQRMGLTSIPGYLRSVKENGLGKTLATSTKEQLHNAPPAMAALMVGVPALSAAKTLVTPEQEGGPGKGEALGKNLGQTIGGIAGGAMPVVGQAVVGGTLGRAGELAGRAVDRLRGRRPSTLGPPALEQAEAQHFPTERVMSPAAAGQPPEMGSL